MFTIVNHRLVGVPFEPAANVGGRMEPSLLIMHETAGRLHDGAVREEAKRSRVSWHVSIERNGAVTQHVPFDVVAWHAGDSVWRGRKGCNAYSIGIELAGPGALTRRGSRAVAWFGQSWPLDELEEIDSAAHGGGPRYWLPFTDAQIVAARDVAAAIVAAYPRITDIEGHYAVSPGRKVDPSPCFPMAAMQSLVWDRHAPLEGEVAATQTRLRALGYYTDGLIDDVAGPRLRSALRAFQEQAGLPLSGERDAATLAALADPGAVPMTTGTRPATTKADVASIETVAVKRLSEGNAALELVDAADKVGAAVAKAQKAKGSGDAIQAVLGWLTTPAGLRSIVVLAVCAVSWWAANKVDWSRVRARVGLGG